MQGTQLLPSAAPSDRLQLAFGEVEVIHRWSFLGIWIAF